MTNLNNKKLTFIAIGECMVELTAQAGNKQCKIGFAGDTFNTTWYMKAFSDEISWDVAYFTRVGEDQLSTELLEFIQKSNINTQYISRDCERHLGLYMSQMIDGDRIFTYWRDNSAAREMFCTKIHFEHAIAMADKLYFSGITLAILTKDNRDWLIASLKHARTQGKTVIFDPNIRFNLWKHHDEIKHYINEAARVSDIVLPSFDDEKIKLSENDESSYNVTNHDYQKKINSVKNEKIKKSLIKLSKVFKTK
mgnify:CR=1 FL=1